MKIYNLDSVLFCPKCLKGKNCEVCFSYKTRIHTDVATGEDSYIRTCKSCEHEWLEI